jgi:FAD/FMN-containing dehydrogenase
MEQAPSTHEEAAAMLAAASAEGLSVRIAGGQTKLGWGHVTPAADVELHTSGLDRIIEHNAGDLTAEIEAGVPLAQAQRAFAEHGQMLALDPPIPGRRSAASSPPPTAARCDIVTAPPATSWSAPGSPSATGASPILAAR